MRWLIGLAVGGLLGLGCGNTVYRSHEGAYFSDKDEDPFFECAPSDDLVCINTYDMQVQTTGGQPPRFQPVYLCRLACSPGDHCFDPNDVCCPGPIHGRNYGKMNACVPVGMCQTATVPDAGSPDRPTDTAAPPADGPEPITDASSPDGTSTPDGSAD